MTPEPYGQLSDRSVQALLAADSTVRGWDAQINRIATAFGAASATPLREQYDLAAQQLARVFSLRSQIDDATDESEPTRRAWIGEILRICDAIGVHYAQQAPALDAWWQLQSKAPELLDALPADIDHQQAQVTAAKNRIGELAAQYPADAVSTSNRDVAAAQAHVDAARETLAAARKTVNAAQSTADTTNTTDTTGTAPPAQGSAAPSGQSLAVAVRRTQESLAAAAALLAQAAQAEIALTAAAAQLDTAQQSAAALYDEVASSLARRSAGTRGQEFLDKLAAVQAHLSPAIATSDPVAAVAELQGATAELSQLKAEIASVQDSEARAQTMLRQELISAQASVTAAANFVATRSSDPEVRAAIDEAQQLMRDAHVAASRDASWARDTARQAVTLAQRVSK